MMTNLNINKNNILGIIQVIVDRARRDAAIIQLIFTGLIAVAVNALAGIKWYWIAISTILFIIYSYFNTTKLWKSEQQAYYDNGPLKKDIEKIKEKLGIS